MHGIVYVPESEAPSDPLEVEGMRYLRIRGPLLSSHHMSMRRADIMCGQGGDVASNNGLLTASRHSYSETTLGAVESSQR